jgi:hypothetical protein
VPQEPTFFAIQTPTVAKAEKVKHVPFLKLYWNELAELTGFITCFHLPFTPFFSLSLFFDTNVKPVRVTFLRLRGRKMPL